MYKAKPRKIIKHYAPKCRPFDIKCLQVHDEKIYCASRNHMYKFNKDLSYDKYGDTYKLKNDQIYIAKHIIKDYRIAPDKIHLIILQEDNSILAVD
jgi:hypothetical protein